MSEIESHVVKAHEEYSKLRISAAIRSVLSISDVANNFVQHNEPWAKIKNDPEAARNDLTFVTNCIKIIHRALEAHFAIVLQEGGRDPRCP